MRSSLENMAISGCTQVYSWAEVLEHINCLYDVKQSLRRIANEDYFGEINHAVVQRCLAGIEPTDNEIRHVLGLSTTFTGRPVNGHHIPEGTQVYNAIPCINDKCGHKSFSPNSAKRRQCYNCQKVRMRKRT